MNNALKARDPDDHHSASWLELLFDLAFVVALASTTHTLVGMAMPEGLLQFIVTFLLLAGCWAGFIIWVSVFEGAVKWHFVALSQIALVLLLATHHDFYEDDYFNFIVIYSLLRGVSLGMYLYVWRNLPEARVFARVQVVGVMITLVPLWAGWWIGDAALREPLFFMTALLQMLIAPLAFVWDKNIAFNVAHIPEQMGLFVCLTLGEGFLAVSHVSELVNVVTPQVLMNGLLCVAIIYGLWRMYFGMLSDIQFHGHHRRAVF